jgi:hypothetical protein
VVWLMKPWTSPLVVWTTSPLVLPCFVVTQREVASKDASETNNKEERMMTSDENCPRNKPKIPKSTANKVLSVQDVEIYTGEELISTCDTQLTFARQNVLQHRVKECPLACHIAPLALFPVNVVVRESGSGRNLGILTSLAPVA